jgi:hypothetical protein
VLIDAKKMTGTISVLDRYDMGRHLASFRDFSVKIVLLCSPAQILSDNFLKM